MSECRKKLLLTYYNTKYEEFRCILVHIMRSTPHIHNALIDDIRDMVHTFISTCTYILYILITTVWNLLFTKDSALRHNNVDNSIMIIWNNENLTINNEMNTFFLQEAMNSFPSWRLHNKMSGCISDWWMVLAAVSSVGRKPGGRGRRTPTMDALLSFIIFLTMLNLSW